MIKLPSGVDIKNLINDLRVISWKASEALLYYAQILKDTKNTNDFLKNNNICLLYTSPSPRDSGKSRMPSAA